MSEPVLWRGTGVAIGGRALLIEGPPGSGKSTLALGLIDRGAVLIGDDAVALQWSGAELLAAPPPRIAGLLECRNVGLLRLPTTCAPVALILTLAPDAPRYVEEAATMPVAGADVPRLLFTPGHAAGPLRAEWALCQHGAGAQRQWAEPPNPVYGARHDR